MELLIIRHGPAGNSNAWKQAGRPDSLRPLTAEGRKKMRKNAAGLHAIVPHVSVLISSPLVRARQTAEIIAKEYGDARLQITSTLEPGTDPEKTLAWLRSVARRRAVTALVGHEPQLSTLVGWLISGRKHSFFEFRKGGACLVHVEKRLAAKEGRLVWLLKPSQLRKLA